MQRLHWQSTFCTNVPYYIPNVPYYIPSELHRPGQKIIYSPGCDAFSEQCGNKDYIQFDRTPFYVEMAELEIKLKLAVGITQKIKMTVAQMLVER